MDNRLRLAETDGLMAAYGQVKAKKAPSFRLSDSQNPEREGVRLSGEDDNKEMVCPFNIFRFRIVTDI